MQTLINHTGQTWEVDQRESERLTTIGGYLMLCGELGCIVVSAALPDAEKRRGCEVLLHQLAATPLGTLGVRLWHPKDDRV